MSKPALNLREVTKDYRRQRVLDGLSLEVHRGEFFGLVGVNGAGKTTCIKAVLDFCDIHSGTIEIFGTPHRETVARSDLVYLPERFLPPYYLKGKDFLAYMSRLFGKTFEPQAVARIFETLDLDLQALDKPVRQYSKGMAQKLGLTACFLSERSLIILDEPMSGLDPKARILLKQHLQRLRGAIHTLFFSTHMLADVAELCDRMGILHGGRLRFIGTPRECCETFGAETLEQAYLNCVRQQAVS